MTAAAPVTDLTHKVGFVQKHREVVLEALRGFHEHLHGDQPRHVVVCVTRFVHCTQRTADVSNAASKPHV